MLTGIEVGIKHYDPLTLKPRYQPFHHTSTPTNFSPELRGI